MFVLCKVSNFNKEVVLLLLLSPFYRSANVPFHSFRRKSMNRVRSQSKHRVASLSFLEPEFEILHFFKALGFF